MYIGSTEFLYKQFVLLMQFYPTSIVVPTHTKAEGPLSTILDANTICAPCV